MRNKENVDQQDRIDVLIERKKKNIQNLTEKKKVDPSLVSKLQSQITQANNKVTELNHRYTFLEQKCKQTEEKCQKLTEKNKQLSEEVDEKEKEIKSSMSKLAYTSKEKQNLEEKFKESKTYINKLEQRILQNSKGVTNQQGTGISTIGTIPTEYEGQDVTIHKLKEIIDNQQYEIKLLTQTLQEKESPKAHLESRFLSCRVDTSEETYRAEIANFREDADNKAFEKSSYDYQTLLMRYQNAQEMIARLTQDQEEKDLQKNINDDKLHRLMRESEQLRQIKAKAEDERNSLYKYAEELNGKIRSLTGELQGSQDGIQLKNITDQHKLLKDIDAKNVEIRQLNALLNQQKLKIEELQQKLEGEKERRTKFAGEQERLGKIDEINELLKQEISKLKLLIDKYENEVEFYKQETETLRKEKDNLRTGLEDFIRKNSTIEQSLDFTGKTDLHSLQTSKVLEELQKVEIEKDKIQETLNQVINQIDLYKEKEKEHEEAFKRKEKQIENLVNSRNIMQTTLGDQVLVKERENKRLKEELSKYKEDLEALKEENKFIRDLLRKQEKFIHDHSGQNKKSC